MMTTRLRQMSAPALSLLAVLALFPVTQVAAQQDAPQTIDLKKYKANVADVIIPVPSEIFIALDKQGGNLNWASEVAPDPKIKPKKPEEIAMLLGAVIANGFVAVEAKQADKVQEIGRRVIELASALGVRDAVLKHCSAIIDASKKDDWLGVRSELDKAQSSVREAMNALKSKDESQLVSIAGWLRGTQALSSLVTKDYKADRAELLHQPDMLITFEIQFKGMQEKAQNNAKVKELREGLQKLKPLIVPGPNGDISQKAVEQIHQITTDLVKAVAPPESKN